MIEKVVITENQRGLLFQNGCFMKLLDPGRYYTWGDREIELLPISGQLRSAKCPLETLLRDPKLKQQTTFVEVGDQQLGLHYKNGKFLNVLPAGRYLFWTISDKHDCRVVDISQPEVGPDVPKFIFSLIPDTVYQRVEVAEYQRGRLCIDGKLEKLLNPGTYYFWKTAAHVEVSILDTRLTQMSVTGQEILTQDKVTLRINYICNYRITDYIKILTETDDYKEQLHMTIQLALRDYVGRQRLDEILERKDEISQYVQGRLKERAASLYVDITDGGVRDIVLPGEIRDIMNTVLMAEKRAQANVITRREEVASTRSLLNTARLMDENKTLYRLKELEYIEKICENVGSISLSGSGDLLTQLTQLLRGPKTDNQ